MVTITNPYSIRLGVLGAGTMGRGIALAALQQNMLVSLYDVSAEMLESARAYAAHHLARKGHEASLLHLELTGELEALRGAGVMIEAVPEKLELKQELFARLDELCPPPAILATNTSTLAVTAIAAACQHPERVAGMHFFNPAPVLPLVEVVRGAQTSPATIDSLVALAKVLGKEPVVVKDTPGFIVNRVARPFYGEALRLVGEGVTTHTQVDRLVRQGAGFRMGPFELMDLIGIDINLAAMQSMYEQTFGEPRYRPHPLQVQMVQQKALGRKSGRGFYRYDEESPQEESPRPRPQKRTGVIWLEAGSWAPGLAEKLGEAGFTLQAGGESQAGKVEFGLVTAGREEGLPERLARLEAALPAHLPLVCQSADVTLAEMGQWVQHPERLVGFDGLFAAAGSTVTLAAYPGTGQEGSPVRGQVEALFATLGSRTEWVQDSPGLVLPRILSMLANEALFAASEGVAEESAIDLSMKLGTNYPYGPIEWAQQIGYAKVLTVLDHLYHEYHEDRYRAAPLLRRRARMR